MKWWPLSASVEGEQESRARYEERSRAGEHKSDFQTVVAQDVLRRASRQLAERVSKAHKYGSHPIRSAGKRRSGQVKLRADTILANDILSKRSSNALRRTFRRHPFGPLLKIQHHARILALRLDATYLLG